MIRLMFYSLLGWAAWRIVEENRGGERSIPLPAPRPMARTRKPSA